MVAFGLAAGQAVAQAVAPEPPRPHQAPPAPEPPSKDQPKPPADELPSLDESLGLGSPSSHQQPAASPKDRDIDRQLRDETPADDFAQAVQLMSQVAGRLEDQRDTGIDTQRMQEEAIRRLDKLISEAKKSPQKQKQKKQQQKQQEQQQEQSQSQQQKSQQQQGKSSESKDQNQENQGQVMDPAQRRAGQLRQVSPGGTAAWGSLPEHVRSSLMQGFSDQFSSMYQSMTEAYYRKLAEDRSRDRKQGAGSSSR